MGRKIPGRKHRGVRDPEQQRKDRFDLIKTKINTPPSNADHQDIPKSLLRIMELKEKVKSGEIPSKKQRNRKSKSEVVSIKPMRILPGEKPIPGFTQETGETNQQFLRRIHRACQAAIKETAFEEKYRVKVKHNPDTGEVEDVEKMPKDELEVYMKKVQKEQKLKGKKKKKKKDDDTPKLTKAQKRQAKLNVKKQKRLDDDVDEFKTFKDSVGFGEVVHEPPSLVKPRRAKNDNDVPRPGKKNLLLKSMFSGHTSDSMEKQKVVSKKPDKPKDKLKKTTNKVIDKKGKRKDLPNAMRRQLDKQQSEIIQAYKELKKKRYITNK